MLNNGQKLTDEPDEGLPGVSVASVMLAAVRSKSAMGLSVGADARSLDDAAGCIGGGLYTLL